jgi:holin-like protein
VKSDFLRTPLQAGFFLLCWIGGEMLVRLLHLPLPGGIVAFAGVLLLLGTRVLPLNLVRGGADWLLAQMLLFFVPALLAVMEHPEFLGVLGLKLLLVIVLGTTAVMVVTGLVVEFMVRRSE